MRNCILIIALLAYLPAHAQKMTQRKAVAAEIALVREAYIKSADLSMDVEARSFTKASDLTSKPISKGSIRKSGQKYCSSFGTTEMIMDGNKFLMVDHEHKKMSYYSVNPFKQKDASLFTVNIDSLVMAGDSVLLVAQKSGEQRITSFPKKGLAARIDIYINDRHFVTRILTTYRPSNEEYEIEINRLDVTYRNIRTVAPPDESFSFGRFFTQNRNTLTPVEKYHSYKLTSYASK